MRGALIKDSTLGRPWREYACERAFVHRQDNGAGELRNRYPCRRLAVPSRGSAHLGDKARVRSACACVRAHHQRLCAERSQSVRFSFVARARVSYQNRAHARMSLRNVVRGIWGMRATMMHFYSIRPSIKNRKKTSMSIQINTVGLFGSVVRLNNMVERMQNH